MLLLMQLLPPTPTSSTTLAEFGMKLGKNYRSSSGECMIAGPMRPGGPTRMVKCSTPTMRLREQGAQCRAKRDLAARPSLESPLLMDIETSDAPTPPSSHSQHRSIHPRDSRLKLRGSSMRFRSMLSFRRPSLHGVHRFIVFIAMVLLSHNLYNMQPSLLRIL